ncbi:MAG: penicillin-binding protein 2 [Elusimicrobia bacterium RIFOXYA2_FULL_39_19]|nr:MAG: penicillin-binding protein 2 [Elusimicrobia bacterium RIFOXYA2_FULL_39_19]
MVWEGESNLIQERFQSKLNRTLIIIIAIYVLIILRFFYFQLIKGTYYYRISEQNSTQLFLERAPRGIIYDCNNISLCQNKPVTLVLFYPFSRKKSEYLKVETIETIEAILPNAKNKIIEGFNAYKVVCLEQNVERNIMFRILEQKNKLKDISVVTEMRRYYPYNEMFSNMLGYISEISPSELDNMVDYGYKQGDLIGKNGIEKKYDEYLRGTDGGWVIESDVIGRQLSISDRIEPEPGNNLQLTIDIELQKVAEEALKKTGCPGAVVGIDPSNGAIRILVSQPGFNPNHFIDNSPERLKYLTDKTLPMFNRAIQGEYAPGSVFKIVTSAAALNENKIKKEDEYYCPGYFTLGRKTFGCWEKKGHKKMDFFSGVKNSCDVYFYNIGLKTGVDDISNYCKMFHLGERLGIDLPSEKTGLIPTKEWRKKRLKDQWSLGDTVNISIGQGYLDVTPLQIASLFATVANKGRIWKPYLVEKIFSNEGNVIYQHNIEKISNVELRNDVWEDITKALKEVVDNGTGHGAYVKGISLAGKTGTAENPRGQTHAWFAAFGITEKPKLAVAVLVEHGGKGGSIAAPIAGRIFQKMKEKTQVNNTILQEIKKEEIKN